MIRVACPHCQRRYRTQTEGMGKTAVCTGCRKTFRIGEVRLPFQWKQIDLGEDSWIGVEAPKEKKELRNCIICQAPLDDNALNCPECGANQITGIVRRSQPRQTKLKSSIWSALPLKVIAAVAALAVLGLGGYWSCRAITRTAMETGETAAYTAMARQAAEILNKGGDQASVAAQFAGRVDDQNLPAFVGMLSAGRDDIRRAAVLLIGCGSFTNLRPVLDMAGNAATREDGITLLEAIGNRRLVTLSNHERTEARQAAAEGLCLLAGLKPEAGTLAQLSQAGTDGEKIARLNELCRSYPAATGRFTVTIDGTTSSFAVAIDQIGTRFYLKVGQTEFRTTPDLVRTFEIPVDRWCAATGVALDAAAIRRMLTGSIRLTSPLGASWRGQVTVTARTRLEPPLPGFLPITPPAAGQTTEAPVILDRLP